MVVIDAYPYNYDAVENQFYKNKVPLSLDGANAIATGWQLAKNDGTETLIKNDGWEPIVAAETKRSTVYKFQRTFTIPLNVLHTYFDVDNLFYQNILRQDTLKIDIKLMQ